MKLFIDDERNPKDIYWIKLDLYKDTDWVITRTFEESIKAIKQYGLPDFISFDHDLGMGQTGYDVAKWIGQNFNYSGNFKWVVHSQNPIGAKNIDTYLNNWKKHTMKNESVLNKYLAKIYNEILMPDERKKAQKAGLIDPREKSPDERSKIGLGNRFIAQYNDLYDIVIYKNPKSMQEMSKDITSDFYRVVIVDENVYMGIEPDGGVVIHAWLIEALINAKVITPAQIPGFETSSWDQHTDKYLCLVQIENNEFVLSDMYKEDIPTMDYKSNEVDHHLEVFKRQCPWVKIYNVGVDWDFVYDKDWNRIRKNDIV